MARAVRGSVRTAAADTPRGQARSALLDAALQLFRAKGYTATTVDELCAAAGVTKGAFFHHFESKEALGVAAVEHWTAVTSRLFAEAEYHRHADPLDRVFAYLRLRSDLVRGSAAEYSCVAGTTVQEIHATSPAIRAAADRCIESGVAHTEADFAEALAAHPLPGVTARDLASHVQTVIQGAFVVAKARDDASHVKRSIALVDRQLRLLFGRS